MEIENHEWADLIFKFSDAAAARDRKPRDFGGDGELLYRFEIHVIDAIGKHPGINVNDVAELMSVTKGAISQVVKKLHFKNYITKRRNTSNAREVLLELTEKGKRVFAAHNEFHASMNRRINERLKNIPVRDLEMFRNMLFRATEFLKELE